MTAQEFISRLRGVRKTGAGWQARCPAHEDENPSLSVSERGGKILLRCHAGCETAAIVDALGLKMADLFTAAKPKGHNVKGEPEAVYPYTDEEGTLLFEVVRFPGKQFRQRRADGKGGWSWKLDGVRRALYRLPEVIKAHSVLVVEGEKDVETACTLGLTATCNPHGAGKWPPEYSEFLKAKRVAVIADADEPGRLHAAQVAGSLFGKVETLKVLELPGAKDLSEWIGRGGTREALLGLIKTAPEWKPAGGSDGLDAVFGYITRFVSLSEAQARAVALWVAHTHSFEAADCTPYLSVNSAEKQSGKTRLLEVLELLVFEPWLTGRVSSAVLARKIDAKRPTLLLDESDTAFGSEKEYAEALRGVLNTGYRRGGASSCCVGQGANITYKDFATFCPKAIAGIGKLPDTVADRSIPVRLKRAQRGKVERFRKREAEREASDISGKLAAWCAANTEKLSRARPEIPPLLSDRQADVSEPLLAIADLVGGAWPVAAREALVGLCADAEANDESRGARLLSDIKGIFTEQKTDRLASERLAELLAAIETSPWAECSRGKPVTKQKLARLLRPFEIRPGTVRFNESDTAKGYYLSQFEEAFSLYLPPATPPKKRHDVTNRENTGENGAFMPSQPKPCDVSENTVSASRNAPCDGVTFSVPGNGRESAEMVQPEPQISFAEDDEVTL